MPLLTSEQAAVEIINREASRRGNREGLVNFTRLVLGAHSAQAKRLVELAERQQRGDDVTGELMVEEPDFSVQREVEGRVLNIDLKADRLPITTLEELVEFYAIDTEKWRPTRQQFSFWGSERSPNFQVRASFEEVAYDGVSEVERAEFRAWAAEHAAIAPPTFAPTREGGEHLLEIVVSDLHAGRASYAEPIGDTIARMSEAISDVLVRASAFEISRVALVLLGDTFNDDNGRRTTTAGTPQESEQSWKELFTAVREGVAEWVSLAKGAAEAVEVYVLEGNHDRERAWYLADALSGMFANWPGVVVNFADTHRAYIEHGSVLIGLTHGDTIKDDDLALVMAREAGVKGKRVLEWHLGHLHTKSENEVHGVLIRRFRTPAPFDDWHYQKGYAHNVRSITGIVWHPERGEQATYPYTFLEERDG